jgi:hypothetical protein
MILVLLCCAPGFATADPIHAIADGAYWHHDSGFVFPRKVGEFELVGIPQDVAGSQEAVAYYARGDAGERTVAAINVYPVEFIDLGEGLRAEQDAHATGAGDTVTLRYFVAKRDWRVRIEVAVPAPGADTHSSIEAFIRGLQWKSLASG